VRFLPVPAPEWVQRSFKIIEFKNTICDELNQRDFGEYPASSTVVGTAFSRQESKLIPAEYWNLTQTAGSSGTHPNV
jgi:hypothetical protein